MSAVRSLTVLYLYDNRISKIERLESVPHLEHLYLQRNNITKIENLSHLAKLKKLYLSGNKISVVENLEKCTMLKGSVLRWHNFKKYYEKILVSELYVDHQRLEAHQNLVLEPRTCKGLKALKILDISKNKASIFYLN